MSFEVVGLGAAKGSGVLNRRKFRVLGFRV